MQLGFTLYEKMHIDGGQITNASLADYKIPGIHDIPPMENEAVEAYQSNGPFGGKGVGELATFGVSPAIANAIDDAIGVRLTELPLTPEAIFRALRAKNGKPLEDEDGFPGRATNPLIPALVGRVESGGPQLPRTPSLAP